MKEYVNVRVRRVRSEECEGVSGDHAQVPLHFIAPSSGS